MQLLVRIILILLATVTITACANFRLGSKEKPEVNKIETQDKKAESPEPVVVSSPQLHKPLKWSLIHTGIQAEISLPKKEAQIHAKISLSPFGVSRKQLHIDAVGFLQLDTLLLQSKLNKDLKIESWKYVDSSKLAITFNDKVEITDTVQFELNYLVRPASLQKRGLIANEDEMGMHFIEKDGEVVQMWTQGQTEYNATWFPTLNQPKQKTTWDAKITVDTPLVAVSNGRMVYKLIGEGNYTYYYKQESPHAPYLSMLAVGKFAITEENDASIPLSYYTDYEHYPFAEAIFGKTPEMIKFFTKKFGCEYPWAKYAQIAALNFSGAMENTSASLFTHHILRDSIELNDYDYEEYIVHELAHQWFGNLVTCESWANLALNEGFASYAEYLWDENINEYDALATLYNFKAGYLRQAQFNTHPLVDYHYSKADQMFDSHSYNKGALLVHQLRHLIGDSAFFMGMSLYLNDNAYATADVDHLRHAFEKASGKDLKPHFSRWWEREGHPEISVNYEIVDSVNKVQIKLEQSQSENVGYYRIPIDLSYTDDAGTHQYTHQLNSNRDRFPISYQGELKGIGVIDSQKVLFDLKEHKPLIFWLDDLSSSNIYTRLQGAAHFSEYWEDISPEYRKRAIAANNSASRNLAQADRFFLAAIRRDSSYYDISPLLKSEDNVVLSLSISYLSKHGNLDLGIITRFRERPSYLVKEASTAALAPFYNKSLEKTLIDELNSSIEKKSIRKEILNLLASKGSANVNSALRQSILLNPGFTHFYRFFLLRQNAQFIEENLGFYAELADKGSALIALNQLERLDMEVTLNFTDTDLAAIQNNIDSIIKSIRSN